MPKREICDVDLTAIKPMLERAEKALSEDDFRLVEGIATLVVQAVEVLRKASASLARMRRVFGLGRSEKTATLKADAANSATASRLRARDGPPRPNAPGLVGRGCSIKSPLFHNCAAKRLRRAA